MLYATVTQRLSDFFPRTLPREEQAYRNYTLDRQFWPYYTDPRFGGIQYNTYVGSVVSTQTYDVTVKGGYFNYVNSLDSVYTQDGTYRYNSVIGYNNLTSVNGNSNIYIGSKSGSFSLNTNNTISIGQDILPENNKIILRPNASQGQIKISPPKSSNEECVIDINKNTQITLEESNINSKININQQFSIVPNSIQIGEPNTSSYFGINGVVNNIGNITPIINQAHITIQIGNNTYKIPIFT